MKAQLLLVLLPTFVLLSWDWLVKRRRNARRPEMSDHDFLIAHRGPQDTAEDAQILRLRRQIAKELGLPVSKLRPEDDLIELRDRYSGVVSGHLALGDLFDDLDGAAGRKAAKTLPCITPDTVSEYIPAFIDRSSCGRDNES